MAAFVTTPFNKTRLKAIETFNATLKECFGNEFITEKMFCDLWMDRLTKDSYVIADGWYDPPPRGTAVLSATANDCSRISFSTLRTPEYWPSDRLIRWNDGLLYVYCSPVSKLDGVPGDFAVTLYFGRNLGIRQHFLTAHRAVRKLLESIEPEQTSITIFTNSQAIFEQYRLQNTVISISDTTPLDLGHTFPRVNPPKLSDHLTEDQRNSIRRGRLFLNGNSEWHIAEDLQFTIEPQLRCVNHSELPQVTFHYLARKNNGSIELQDDVEKLLGAYDLLSS
ncbi:MAG: hypothetical protein LAO78_00115 [Acidobacteriia bacterium]|nr:hypothetical protein [Terriglobia bacterium]